jgi:hypothetical protein
MIDPNQEREILRGRPAPGTGSPAPTFVRSTGCRTDGAAGILGAHHAAGLHVAGRADLQPLAPAGLMSLLIALRSPM